MGGAKRYKKLKKIKKLNSPAISKDSFFLGPNGSQQRIFFLFPFFFLGDGTQGEFLHLRADAGL